MAKFKIGDRVRIIKFWKTEYESRPKYLIGTTATIKEEDHDWDGIPSYDVGNDWRWREDELELVEPEKKLYQSRYVPTVICEVCFEGNSVVVLKRVDSLAKGVEICLSTLTFKNSYHEYVPPKPTTTKVVKKEGWIIHATSSLGNHFIDSRIHENEELARKHTTSREFSKWKDPHFVKIEWEETVDVPDESDTI